MAIQPDPPKLNHIAPIWFRELWNALWHYLRGQRVVGNEEISVSDAPGGGLFLHILDGPSGILSSQNYPFKCYSSSYQGEGSQPSDQGLKVRFKIGTVNNLPPTNINQEFSCAAATTTFFWIQANFDSYGYSTGSTIEKGSAIPTDPEGSPDSPPPKSCRGIASVLTVANGIKEINGLTAKGSFDVIAVVTNVGCGNVTKIYQWTSH